MLTGTLARIARGRILKAIDVAAYAVQLSAGAGFADLGGTGRGGRGGLFTAGRITTAAARGRGGCGRRGGLRFAVT